MPERMHVSAPASAANLGPGFDCLAVALELRNEVTIGPGEGDGVEVTVEGEGVRAASRGADNLFARAFAAAGADPRGLRFEMRNRIPFYRGLGSSAATIAAGVAAGLAWTGRDVDPLPAAVELEGHPDNVAAALLGGLTVAWTADGGPAAIRLRGCPVDFVVAVPGGRASDQARPRGPARDDRPRRRGPYDGACRPAGRGARVRPDRASERCARRPPARALPGAVRPAARRGPGPARRPPGLRRDDLRCRPVGARLVRAGRSGVGRRLAGGDRAPRPSARGRRRRRRDQLAVLAHVGPAPAECRVGERLK